MMAAGKHIGVCSCCGYPGVQIVFGWSTRDGGLCNACNTARIRNRNALKARNADRKSYHHGAKKLKRQKAVLKKTKRQKEKQDEDAVVNREIWHDRKHVCFECTKPLDFKNPPKYVFSHVHSKGSRPDLRHEKSNIVLHCRGCHQVWEFGAREFMPKTSQLFEKLTVEHQDNKFRRE